ncbi:MAG: penicillin-binding protein 1C [Nitrospirae bacterium]|nr:penicillin-binding protein 1C [Nitrospirota bacterium]
MKSLFLIWSLFGTFLLIADASALPSFYEVKNSFTKSDAVLLDRQGEVIHQMRIDPKGRRLEWTPLRDVSPSLINVIIYSEDRRFYKHSGVDWLAIGSAAIGNIVSERKRGASTITMQLASILDKGIRAKKGKRAVAEKWAQIKIAQEIEGTWSKDEILEAYLNLITFRGEIQGISAASKALFDKSPDGLNDVESMIAASLVRSPNAGIDDITKRACRLAASLKAAASCSEIREIAFLSLSRPYHIKPNIAIAPHAARQLLSINDGRKKERVISTINGRLQQFVLDSLQSQLALLKSKNVHDSAALVVDNETGDILAYVGNSGISASARHVDGVAARRQAGSALKPFLYGYAIERKILTAASILDDSPINISTPRGVYAPHNYDSSFKGYVSVRTALSSSLNMPAVRTLMLVGTDAFVKRLGELGFGDLNDGEYYGLSLALGSLDVSLYELVNSYRTLANSGVWSELRLTVDKKIVRKRIMQADSAFIISGILSDREARNLTFGVENPLSTPFWTAVKTGTSKDMRDNWCVGYSQKYTVGVWVGNFSGEPMWNVSGITGAAPVWLEIMKYLHKALPSNSPAPPAGIFSMPISFESEIETPRNEWFISGTGHGLPIKADAGYKTTFISYPTNGVIIAIDPDIPAGNHIVPFEYQDGGDRYEWTLNGKRTGIYSGLYLWKPEIGKFRLSIIDKDNQTADTVEFEVR